MLILRENALTSVGDRRLYKEEGFDGVSLKVVNDVVTEKIVFQDGYAVGEYISKYIDVENTAQNIISTALDDEYEEPCSYNDSLFTGVAYRFEGDACVAELEYEDGWLVAEVNYRSNGELEDVDVGDDDLSQRCLWFESGAVQEFECFRRGEYKFWVKLNAENVVTTLVIEGDYFTKVKQDKDQLAFDMYNNEAFAEDLSAAEYLFISGDGINETVVDNLSSQDGLKDVQKLSVVDSTVTPSILEKLVPLENLQQLLIETETNDMDALRKFKVQRPDCFVELNREEVSI